MSPTLTLKNILAYNRSKANDGFSYDGTPYPIFTTGRARSVADGTHAVRSRSQGIFDPKTKQFSEEFQIQGKGVRQSPRLCVVGAYYLFDQTYDIPSNLKGFRRDLRRRPTVFAYQAPSRRISSRALFAQGSYKITDQLSFTGGIRYSWDKG